MIATQLTSMHVQAILFCYLATNCSIILLCGSHSETLWSSFLFCANNANVWWASHYNIIIGFQALNMGVHSYTMSYILFCLCWNMYFEGE